MPGLYGSQLEVKISEASVRSPAFEEGKKDSISIWLNMNLVWTHFKRTLKSKVVDSYNLMTSKFKNVYKSIRKKLPNFLRFKRSIPQWVNELVDIIGFFDFWVSIKIYTLNYKMTMINKYF